MRIRTLACLQAGWHTYTRYNADFEGAKTDMIIESLTRRTFLQRITADAFNLTSVWTSLLSAVSLFRLALASKSYHVMRKLPQIPHLYFLASEKPESRMQFYPRDLCRLTIILDVAYSYSRLYELFYHIQDCVNMQTLQLTFSRTPSETHLCRLYEILKWILHQFEPPTYDGKRLKLIVDFPATTPRSRVMYTAHRLLHALSIDVMVSWRGAMISRFYLRAWAKEA